MFHTHYIFLIKNTYNRSMKTEFAAFSTDFFSQKYRFGSGVQINEIDTMEKYCVKSWIFSFESRSI